ncbi:hypothetical protein PINS_up000528 [Pythium insidiosum]|nr:hypothetical protein PINS_up000528 [Pythium insidiosum]
MPKPIDHTDEDDGDCDDRLAVELGVNLADAFDCLEGGALPLIPSTTTDDLNDSATVLLDVDHVVLEFLTELLAQQDYEYDAVEDDGSSDVVSMATSGVSLKQFLSSFDRLQLINA